MKNKLLTVFLILYISTSITYAQDSIYSRIYNLYDVCKSADFNYQAIEFLNLATPGLSMLDSVFSPVKGEYVVYRFLCHEKGELFDGSGNMDIYRLIMLKVNSDNFITDGYQYHLTNAESPATCRLYRSSCWLEKTDYIKIEQLKFVRREFFYDWSDEEYCTMIPLQLNEMGKLCFNPINNK